MAVSFSRYLQELSEPIHYPRARVEFLRREDETLEFSISGDVLIDGSGSLNISFTNGARRSVDLTLINITGDFTPVLDSVWIQRKIKLFLGLEIDGEDKLFPQGVFILDNPSQISSSSGNTLTIRGIDKFGNLDGTTGGETPSIYNIPVGSSIETSLRDILTEQNVNDTKELDFDDTFAGEVTPYSIWEESGSTYGKIVNDLAFFLSANVYYNTIGNLTYIRDIPDSEKAPLFDFESGDNIYNGLSANYEFNGVFNEVLVIGDNINGVAVSSRVRNDNPLSPTSTLALNFVRTKTIKDEFIDTTNKATLLAEYWLKRLTFLESSVTITCRPIYHLDVDSVIRITDPNLNLNKERYLITSITLPISNSGNMTINAIKTSELDFTEV